MHKLRLGGGDSSVGKRLFLPTACCHTVDKHCTHSSSTAKVRNATARRLTRALAKTKAARSTFCSVKAETKAGPALPRLVHFWPMTYENLTANKGVCYHTGTGFYSILVSHSLNNYQSKTRSKLYGRGLLVILEKHVTPTASRLRGRFLVCVYL